MFDMFKVCVFSAINGVVLDHGVPVKGARIIRTYEWAWGGDAEERDEVITNDKGEFQMPAIHRMSITGAFLPHEPHVTQLITILANGREYMAWSLSKRDYEENSETGGVAANITCRFENEVKHRGKVFGICEYENIAIDWGGTK